MDPDQCVASRQKTLCVYILAGDQCYRMIAPAHVVASVLGLKWDTVKKRRLRGSPWSESFLPISATGVERRTQGHSIHG